MQQLMVVGDVHGCFHTLQKLVEDHWDPETMLLIQVGDLVNKGLHSVKCIRYWRDLQNHYSDRVILLQGNHELKFVEHLREAGFYSSWGSLKFNLRREGLDVDEVVYWLENLPLKWENEHLLISHAGVGKGVKKPFKPGNSQGVLYNKKTLKDLGKLQIKGHSIVDGHKPLFKPSENAWYIDTGAWTKRFLSALVINEDGSRPRIERMATQAQDRVFRWAH